MTERRRRLKQTQSLKGASPNTRDFSAKMPNYSPMDLYVMKLSARLAEPRLARM
jgi:hypothetical protein